ncbi:hypothetical protein ACOMHN_056000 [Nucella lapillus]
MTFTEMCNACDNSCKKSTGGAIGEALERCLARAISTQRVTVGIQDCAKVLGCAPERVMLCVIPDMAESADVGLHIQHTLVRSFCWEHDIRLLSVKNSEKLQNILNCASSDSTATTTTTTGQTENGDTTTPIPLPSVSCLLIEAPEEALSSDEEYVCNFHDTVIFSNVFPKPIVELPI